MENIKIIRIKDQITIVFEDGSLLISKNCTDSIYNEILKCKNKEEVITIFEDIEFKNSSEEVKKSIEANKIIKKVDELLINSKIITKENNSYYWKNISTLSLPIDLTMKILIAEKNEDKEELKKLQNFWSLMSINKDTECRKNLYWFLQRWGFTLTKYGLFVAYRNIQSTGEEEVYTDNYTHTMKIKIGEPVRINKDYCDCNSKISCSRGLHCGGEGWLKKNYFGDTGVACLINPAMVVAVPHEDNYGKLRTCEYIPIKEIEFDIHNKVIPIKIDEIDIKSYIYKLLPKDVYNEIKATEETPTYQYFKKENIEMMSMADRLLNIALQCKK